MRVDVGARLLHSIGERGRERKSGVARRRGLRRLNKRYRVLPKFFSFVSSVRKSRYVVALDACAPKTIDVFTFTRLFFSFLFYTLKALFYYVGGFFSLLSLYTVILVMKLEKQQLHFFLKL